MSAKIAKTAPTRAQAAPLRKTSSKTASSGKSAGLTRETLAGDIAAFRKAGGHIEVLGHTPFRTAAPSRSAPKTSAAAGNTASASKA